MTIPKHCGMPPLRQNVEGLRSHALLFSVFVPEPEVSPEVRRWRTWLIHCLLKTARHYNEARAIILAQIHEDTRPANQTSGGQALPIFDFALAMEDCITSLEKISAGIKELVTQGAMRSEHLLSLNEDRFALNALRRQQEHMHVQLARGETGQGPIYVTISEDGEGMRLRKLSMSFAALYRLIDAAYRDVALLFPAHAVDSAPTRGGFPTISISATVEIIEPGKPPRRVE